MTEEFCCDKFKEECDDFNQFGIKQDGIGRSNYDGEYYFYHQGCKASFPLKYCPNCGARISVTYPQ